MGWGLGFDSNWDRWIGYSVPATCDFPNCNADIDRGLAHVCSGEPKGGERGCGLYFCEKHHPYGRGEHHSLCYRCYNRRGPFKPKPERMSWVKHLMTDESWAEWREVEGDGYAAIAAAWSALPRSKFRLVWAQLALKRRNKWTSNKQQK